MNTQNSTNSTNWRLSNNNITIISSSSSRCSINSNNNIFISNNKLLNTSYRTIKSNTMRAPVKDTSATIISKHCKWGYPPSISSSCSMRLITQYTSEYVKNYHLGITELLCMCLYIQVLYNFLKYVLFQSFFVRNL